MGPTAYHYATHSLKSSRDMVPIVAAAQASLCIERGPVFKVDILDVDGEDQMVLSMVAHHLVVDVVSWRVIGQDLSQVLETGSMPTDTPISFRSWLDVQADHNKTVEAHTLLPFAEA